MRVNAIMLAVVFAIGCSVGPVMASPSSDIKAARDRAVSAAATLDDLSADLEERNEDYLEVTDALARTRAKPHRPTLSWIGPESNLKPPGSS
jgi:hypothetical protein